MAAAAAADRRSHQPGPRRLAWAGLLLLAVAYVWLLLPLLDHPLVYDDVNFAFAARAVAESGLPYANAGYMSDRWDFSQREQWALWHPPLYIVLLGLQFAAFGVSEVSARLFGLACALVTAYLVYLTGRGLAEERQSQWATGLLAAAFYLLSPLTLQSALILDIDGTVLTLLLTAALWVLVRFPPERHPRALLALTGLFTLSLWAKLTTPLGLLGCLVLVRLLGGQFRQAGRELLIVGGAGGGLFLVTWWLASLICRMPFGMPFGVTWIEFVDAADSSHEWLRSADGVLRTLTPGVIWAGPALGALFGLAGLGRLVRYARTRRTGALDLIVGFGLVVYLVYLIKLAGFFPKYHVAMVPSWALAAAVLVARAGRHPTWPEGCLLLAGFVATTGYIWWGVPDGWLPGYDPRLVGLLLVAPLLIALGLGLLDRRIAGRPVGQGFVLGLAVVALAWGPAVQLRLRAAEGSTTYFFGTSGQRAAAEVVDRLTGPDEFYAGSKDVAWYARNQHYIDQDTLDYFTRLDGGRFSGQLVGYQVRVLALWSRPDYLKAFYRQALSPAYELAAERGDYAVWVRR